MTLALKGRYDSAASRLVMTKKGARPVKFSLVPMLLKGQSIPLEARQALRESRIKDAAEILMQQYGLSCVEAGDLFDVSVCEEDRKA